MKFGMRSRSVRSSCWSSGRSPISWSAAASKRTVVSWPAANRFAATRTTSMTSGSEPSGKVAVREAGEHVAARLAAPVLDVRREPVVEELERAVLQLAVVTPERRRRPSPWRNDSWSSSGTPSRSAITSMAKGFA